MPWCLAGSVAISQRLQRSARKPASRALRGAICASRLFADLGFEVDPAPDAPRTDIIQAIKLGDPELLAALCRTVQRLSPVSSYVQPIPDVVPGYADRVLMAAGTFVEGSTIELSCDGPLRPPFVAYLQGGLSYAHCRLALEACVAEMAERLATEPVGA